jgi:hypothetical protein
VYSHHQANIESRLRYIKNPIKVLGLLDLEGEGNMIFRNVGDDLPIDTG